MRLKVLAAILLVVLAVPAAVTHAQGPIVQPPAPMPPVEETPQPPPPPVPLVWPGPVTIELHRVGATIQDQVATTHVEQTFVNESDSPVEGTYLFPLPEESAISDFNMLVDGQKIEGQIMRRDEARAIYESIVRRQRDPALLEYVGRDLFQARIFPIPPGGERKIELTYSQVLPMENGLVHYQYPLRTDPFVNDLGTGGTRLPVAQFALSADIQTTSPLKAIYSPSHRMVVSREGDQRALVGYEELNAVPASDFDLYFSMDDSQIGVSLLSYKPDDEDGFFLLLAAPNVEVDASQVVARDVLLVLDTSGSMQGPKIEQARNALLYVLDRLNPEDRFNVVAFSTGVRQFAGRPQPAGQAGAARAFVGQLEAGGGTDINRALLEALAQVDPERPTVIIFLTDGLPTEGETDPQHILDNVRQDTGSNVQVFAFGVGDDVNTVLLDSLSQENRGASAYVRPYQAIDEVVSAFYAKVATPVLSSLDLDLGDALAQDLYPYPVPDLFAGSQLVLLGRYRTGGPVTVTLAGTVNGAERSFVFEDLSLNTEGGEPFIARLWATRKIGYLVNEIRLRGQNPELVDEVIRLSTKYGIATPYTSFFVPEPELTMPPMPQSGQSRGTPAPFPTAVAVEKYLEAQARDALAAAPAEAPAGAAAVEESVAREALRSADTVAADGEEASGLRHAQDKAFAYQAGLWVDTAYTDRMDVVDLSFGSDEYFDLLRQHPQWAAYLAVSPNLLVVLDGTAYRIVDTGQQALAEPKAEAGTTATKSPEPTATPDEAASVTAMPPTDLPAVAVQPPQADQPAAPIQVPAQTPFCTAPALGVGLLLMPGYWAWRRQRR